MIIIKTFRSKKYLDFIRSKPCICGCGRKAEAHHEKLGGLSGGMSIKPHDCWTIPLSASCHKIRNVEGRKTYYKNRNIDLKNCVIMYMTEYLITITNERRSA